MAGPFTLLLALMFRPSDGVVHLFDVAVSPYVQKKKSVVPVGFNGQPLQSLRQHMVTWKGY